MRSRQIGALIARSLDPLTARMVESLQKLMHPVALNLTHVTPGMKVDTAALERHSARLKANADGAVAAGNELHSKLSALTFTSG